MKIKSCFSKLTSLVVCLIAFSACGGGGGDGGGADSGPPSSTLEVNDLIFAEVTGTGNPIGAIATDKNGKETIGILVERDTAGNPIKITGAVYTSEQGDAVILEVGGDGRPVSLTDSSGTKAVFENYTTSTVDISTRDASGNLLTGPTTVTVDSGELIELITLFSSSFFKTTPSITKNGKVLMFKTDAGSAGFKWGSFALRWAGCAVSIGATVGTSGAATPAMVLACGSALLGEISQLTENQFDDAVSLIISTALCRSGGDVLSCLPALVDGILLSDAMSDTKLPTAPTNIRAEAMSSTQINLSWTESTDNIGVTGYKVYRNGTRLKLVDATSASDTNLVPSTRYCYTVSARDARGNTSAQSIQACATTLATATTTFSLTITPSGTGSGTVTSSPSGINCGSTCSAFFALGTPVTLTPLANLGSIFTGWSGDCTGTGNCILAMDGDTSVTAIFDTAGGGGGATITWEKTFGGTSRDVAYSVQQTTDGGYIMVGETSSFGAGNGDVYLIKTDANGNSLWEKRFGGAFSDKGHSVQQTMDGGYIITGLTLSFGAGNGDVWLIKTNENGNRLWDKTFGGLSSDEGRSVQQTTDGGYIITGQTNTFGTGNRDVYLIKTDANGNSLWEKRFGGAFSDKGHSVQQTTDGGYIITGRTGSFDGREVRTDVYLIKTDEGGNLLWEKAFADGAGNSVQQTTDGGYIIAGAGLIKTDGNGEVIWWKTGTGANSVQQTTDGGYITTRRTALSSTGYDVSLAKTDANGNSLWWRTFDRSFLDEGYSVQQTKDGGYIIAGKSLPSSGRGDVYLIKTDADGNVR